MFWAMNNFKNQNGLIFWLSLIVFTGLHIKNEIEFCLLFIVIIIRFDMRIQYLFNAQEAGFIPRNVWTLAIINRIILQDVHVYRVKSYFEKGGRRSYFDWNVRTFMYLYVLFCRSIHTLDDGFIVYIANFYLFSLWGAISEFLSPKTKTTPYPPIFGSLNPNLQSVFQNWLNNFFEGFIRLILLFLLPFYLFIYLIIRSLVRPVVHIIYLIRYSILSNSARLAADYC